MLLFCVLNGVFASDSFISQPMKRVRLKPGSMMFYQKDMNSDLVIFGMNIKLPVNLQPAVADLYVRYIKKAASRFSGYTNPEQLPVSMCFCDTSPDILRFVFSFLSQDADDVIKEWFNTLEQLELDPALFEEVKDKLIKEVKAEEKEKLSWELLLKEGMNKLYPEREMGSRYQPSSESVSKVSISQLKSLHEQLMNPLRMGFFVHGNLELKKVVTILHSGLARFQVSDIDEFDMTPSSGVIESRYYSDVDESRGMLLFPGPALKDESSLSFLSLAHSLEMKSGGDLLNMAEKVDGIYDLQITVMMRSWGSFLAVSWKDKQNAPQRFAKYVFEKLALLPRKLKERNTVEDLKEIMGSRNFEIITRPNTMAIKLCQLIGSGFPYALPYEYSDALDTMTGEQMIEDLHKYINTDHYVYVSQEPESNRDAGTKKRTEFNVAGTDVVVIQEASKDILGISWGFDFYRLEGDALLQVVAGIASGITDQNLKNRELEALLRKKNPSFSGGLSGEMLIMLGQVSREYFSHEFVDYLPWVMFDRRLDESVLQSALSSLKQKQEKLKGDWITPDRIRNAFLTQNPSHVFLEADVKDANYSVEEVQAAMDKLLTPEKAVLFIKGNVSAEFVKKKLESAFKRFNETRTDKSKNENSDKGNARNNLESLKQKISIAFDKPATRDKSFFKKKVALVQKEDEYFHEYVGTFLTGEELDMGSLVSQSFLSQAFYKKVQNLKDRFEGFKAFLSLHGDGGALVPYYFYYQGKPEDAEEIRVLVRKILMECINDFQKDGEMLEYIKKSILLAHNTLRIDNSIGSLYSLIMSKIGFKTDVMEKYIVEANTVTSTQMKAGFDKLFKRDFVITYMPE
jgi:predicted Zn-dependent peptidase